MASDKSKSHNFFDLIADIFIAGDFILKRAIHSFYLTNELMFIDGGANW